MLHSNGESEGTGKGGGCGGEKVGEGAGRVQHNCVMSARAKTEKQKLQGRVKELETEREQLRATVAKDKVSPVSQHNAEELGR